MIYTVPTVRIDLLSFPPAGEAGLVIRVRINERDMINRAAALLNMKQADFLRVVTVNAAKEVIQVVHLLTTAPTPQNPYDTPHT